MRRRDRVSAAVPETESLHMLLGSERRTGSGDRLKRFEPLVGYGVRRRSASVGGGIEAKRAVGLVCRVGPRGWSRVQLAGLPFSSLSRLAESVWRSPPGPVFGVTRRAPIDWRRRRSNPI